MHRHLHRMLVRFMGRMIGRWTLGACSRFIGVGRWTFLFCLRHQFHSAFRTIAGMIRDDFRMHWARVFLFLLLLACRAVGRRGDRRRALVVWAIGVNRP